MLLAGSGALNLDLFYEVPELEALDFSGIRFLPGGEVSGDRSTLFRLREYLESRGQFLGSSGGGSAANTIWALAQFGFQTAFIGACGADPEGEEVLQEMLSSGVDLSWVRVGGSTGLALIILDQKKDRFIFVSPGSCEEILADFDPPIPEGIGLHLSSLGTDTGLNFHLRLVQKGSGFLSFDPGEIYVARGVQALVPLISRTNYLFLTETELQKLGKSPAEILSLGPRAIFLKRGAQGAGLFREEGYQEWPAYPAFRIVDNTGAGDFFDAGVLAALLKGWPPEKALLLGLKVAAASLSDYGRRGCPGREEFLNWLREMEKEGDDVGLA